MAGKTLIYQFFGSGSSKTIAVPRGYSNQVIAYVWGAGGGTAVSPGGAGGGGGFTAGIITVNSDSEIAVSVGGEGTGTSGYRPPGLGGRSNNSFINMSGGDGGLANDEDGDSASGAGGGAASAIFVDGIPVLVAGGGGGGGGYGEDGAGGATPGLPGGVATKLNTLPRGQKGADGGSGAGGGGGGYPKGGATGTSYGDDQQGSQGGYGGQNYANTIIVSDNILESGTGTAPGGLRLNGNPNPYYPSRQRGYAGYPGAVVLIFVRSFQAWIKDSGDWKQVTQGWVKTAERVVYRDVIPTPETKIFTTIGTSSFVVPAKVTSITVQASGGGGGGGGADSGDTNHKLYGLGGSPSNLQSTTLTVTPGDTISFTIGIGGVGATTSEGSYPAGTQGSPTIVRLNGTTVLTVVGGVGGASRASSSGPNLGLVSTNGGSNGGDGSSTSYKSPGSRGQSGKVKLSYTPTPSIEVVEDGGWKQITRAWMKHDNNWTPIETSAELAPILAPESPTTYQEVNFVIAANTTNYVLSDYLDGSGYFPGKTIINLTVNPGVEVTSTSSGSAALTIDGLRDGDVVNFTNNGYVVGKGGFGGAPGEYSSGGGGGGGKGGYTSVYAYNGKYNSGPSSPARSVPGRPGGMGGTGLELKFSTTIINNGTIAGGGGGGGGGGGNTGGQGGGGAGYGEGANNGTLTAAGAGAGIGGNGGALGQPGSAGTAASSAGGAAGRAGFAMLGREYATFSTAGTILGPIKYENSGVIVWSTASSV